MPKTSLTTNGQSGMALFPLSGIDKEFKKYNCGYPCGSITPENWSSIIQEMIDDLQFISEYSWDFDKDEEVDKHKDHFFYLFSKWFFHIWY